MNLRRTVLVVVFCVSFTAANLISDIAVPEMIYTAPPGSIKKGQLFRDSKASYYYANHEDYNVIILGTSLAGTSIRENLFEETLAKRGFPDIDSFNLSRVGADMAQNHTLLERIVSEDMQGKWLILEATQQTNQLFVAHTLPSYRFRDLPRNLSEILGSELPLKRKISRLSQLCRWMIKSYQTGRFFWLREYLEMKSDNYQGWHPAPPSYASASRVPDHEKKLKASELEIEFMRKQLKIAQEYGINLVYIVPARTDRTLDPRVYLEEEHARGEFMVIDLNDDERYPELFRHFYFYDEVHVNYVGARRTTQVIAGKLAEHMLKKRSESEQAGPEMSTLAQGG